MFMSELLELHVFDSALVKLTHDQSVQLSIAISLKRIADKLEKSDQRSVFDMIFGHR